jgi:DNA-binding Lrp family transcriptional regulator
MFEAEDWWEAIDAETLRCLSEHGPMSPADLGKDLGISEDGAASLIAGLVREGKGRICLVAAAA